MTATMNYARSPITPLVAALAAIPFVGLSAQSSFTISNANDSEFRDGRFDDTDFDDVGNGSSLGSDDLATGSDQGNQLIGQIGSGNPRERQMAMYFDLPDLGGETLDSATLRVFLNDTVNDDPGIASLGAMSVFSEQGENDGTENVSGFNLGSDSGADIATSGSATGQFHEIDVTSIVQSDYDNDSGGDFGPVSFFRLEMDNAQVFENASGNNRYFFDGGNNANPPQLEVNTVPEPSAYAAFAGALALAVVCLRRRRS